MNNIEIEYITVDGNYKTEGFIEHEDDATDVVIESNWLEAIDEKTTLVSPSELDDRFKSASPKAADSQMECQRIKIASIHGWPETKIVMKNKCWKVFGKRICTKIPRPYRRSSQLTIFAEVCVPSTFEDGTKKVVTKCAIVAAAASVAVAIASGGTGALPAFKASFIACLKSQIGPETDLIDYRIATEKETGDWSPV
jgi:hypothetical protein